MEKLNNNFYVPARRPLNQIYKEFSTDKVTNDSLIHYLFDSMGKLPMKTLFSRCNQACHDDQCVIEDSRYEFLNFGEFAMLTEHFINSAFYDEGLRAARYLSYLQIGFYVGEDEAGYEGDGEKKPQPISEPIHKIRYFRDEDRTAIFTQSLFYLIDLKRYFEFLSKFESEWKLKCGYFMKKYYDLRLKLQLPIGLTIGETLRLCFTGYYEFEYNKDFDIFPLIEIVRSTVVLPFVKQLSSRGVTVQQIEERTEKYINLVNTERSDYYE